MTDTASNYLLLSSASVRSSQNSLMFSYMSGGKRNSAYTLQVPGSSGVGQMGKSFSFHLKHTVNNPLPGPYCRTDILDWQAERKDKTETENTSATCHI